MPDVIVGTAGSWDALHNRDADAFERDAVAVRDAVEHLPKTKLCKKVEASDAHPAKPTVVWMTQPHTVQSRLRSPEKRQYMADPEIRRVNAALVPDDGQPYDAVADMYKVRRPASCLDPCPVPVACPRRPPVTNFRRCACQVTSSRGFEAADGVHYGDSVYNVAFQMVSNAALGAFARRRCARHDAVAACSGAR